MPFKYFVQISNKHTLIRSNLQQYLDHFFLKKRHNTINQQFDNYGILLAPDAVPMRDTSPRCHVPGPGQHGAAPVVRARVAGAGVIRAARDTYVPPLPSEITILPCVSDSLSCALPSLLFLKAVPFPFHFRPLQVSCFVLLFSRRN